MIRRIYPVGSCIEHLPRAYQKIAAFLQGRKSFPNEKNEASFRFSFYFLIAHGQEWQEQEEQGLG